MAFHRCSEYDAEVRRLREENERQRFDILAMNQSLDLLREENGRLAKPIPVATPAVPASSVPEEWREVLRECADDLAIELDMRYQSRSHYPSELRKYENEMQPVYRARALLQSTGDKK
jgi:hypothetical protein